MGDSEAREDFPDDSQRAAFCNSEWERAQNMSDRTWLTANQTGTARRETLEGREHVVVPATLVQEQVLNNNLGKTFLPADEITDTWADIANHAPVLVDHPRQRGRPVSAKDPTVLNAQGVGRLFNVRAEDGKLKGDVFLDPSRRDDIEALDAVLERVESGYPVELSTSFPVRESEDRQGVHNGETFEKVIRPGGFDHLAVFVDKEGACSVEDGCGLGINCDCGEHTMDADNASEVADSIWERLKSHFTREETVDAENEDAARDEAAEENEPEEGAENRNDDTTEEPPAWASNLVDQVESLGERMDDLEEAAQPAVNELEQKRNRLVSEIAQNSPFDESDLEGESIERLEKLRSMSRAENYAGRGGPRDSAGEEIPEFIEPPKVFADNTDEQED